MIGYWINFAKHGDPNGAGDRHGTTTVSEVGEGSTLPNLPSWPRYGADGPAVLSLMDNIQVDADVRSEHQCPLWDDLDPEGLY